MKHCFDFFCIVFMLKGSRVDFFGHPEVMVKKKANWVYSHGSTYTTWLPCRALPLCTQGCKVSQLFSNLVHGRSLRYSLHIKLWPGNLVSNFVRRSTHITHFFRMLLKIFFCPPFLGPGRTPRAYKEAWSKLWPQPCTFWPSISWVFFPVWKSVCVVRGCFALEGLGRGKSRKELKGIPR